MKRVNNSDINFLLNPKLVNLSNFTIKFYTTSPESFFIRKTQDDVKTIERLSEEETCVDYYLKLDWIELVTLGEGVLQYQLTNNYEDGDRADDYYNVNVERTTNYYIDSNVIVDEDEAESYSEIVAELGDKIDAEIVRSESADTEQLLALNTEIETRQNQVDNLLDLIETISGDTDMSNYYKKTETSGKTELSTAFNDKLDVSAYTPTDLSNYYTKQETSGASQISTALSDKQNTLVSGSNIKTINDISILGSGNITIEGGSVTVDPTLDSGSTNPVANSAITAAFDNLNDIVIEDEEVTAAALNDLKSNKLDVSAYTPVDLTNYYTKSETSGKTELSTAFNDKLDVTAYTPTDLSNYYTKSETSGATQISTALDAKLDVSAYTPTDLSNYYTKSETSGATEISTALVSKADAATTYTKTEVDTALASKQTTLTAGTGISIVDNVISATGGGGGGGKAVNAGTNISITTGETADTINCTLPITANTSARRNDIAIGNDIIGVGDYRRIIVGSGNKNKYGNSRTSDSILIGTPDGSTAIYNVVNAANCIGIGGNGLEVGYDNASGYGSIAIGYGSKSIINKSLAIGYNTVASGTTQTNINNQIKVDTSNQVYIYNKDNTEMICLQDQLGGSSITIDPTLDSGSTNPVANSAITAEFDDLKDVVIENEETTSAALNELNIALGGLSLVKLTQSEYDALATKDNNTLYIIV